MPNKIKKLAHIDPWLLLATVGLLGLGSVMVFSASSLIGVDRYGDSTYFLKRHLLSAGIGLTLCVSLFFVNIRHLRKLALPLLILTTIALIATAVTGIGHSAKNASRWLTLAG